MLSKSTTNEDIIKLLQTINPDSKQIEKVVFDAAMEQSKDELLKFVDTIIPETYPQLEYFTKMRNSIEYLKTNPIHITEKKIDFRDVKEIHYLTEILDGIILLSFLRMDVACSLKCYLKADIDYERKYALKQLLVLTLEGYKKIHGFEGKKKDGSKDSRKNSFWIKVIQPIMKDVAFPQAEYIQLTERMLDLEKRFPDKTYRDLAVHYDKNPSKVYDMLITINMKDTFPLMIDFVKLLNEIVNFLTRLIKQIEKKHTEKCHQPFSNIISMIDNSPLPKEQKEKLRTQFDSLMKRFTSFVPH